MSFSHQKAWREFHISRQARDRYQIDQSLFSTDGHIILANVQAARRLEHRINAKRDVARFPEQAVKAGQLNAMGLIDEILHFVIARYCEQRNPAAFADALHWLDGKLGAPAVNAVLVAFADQFPPLTVYLREITAGDYLAGTTGGVDNRQLLLEELLMLWLTNENPACSPYLELFDDTALEHDTDYRQLVTALQEFFATQPHFGPENQQLVEMLHAPAVVEPHSLERQLQYIMARWGYLLGDIIFRLLRSLDLMAEEQKTAFAGPGPAMVPLYDQALAQEPERFSEDKEWMPRAAIIAKNSYVWLSQLSRQYQREITQLDQIPDEELDQLAHRGFTGLWLIGLWERSTASARIKQMTGNPEAAASAYSLAGYDIAGELGGNDALENLRARAWQRGIRLASDMVPNHMGIDAQWVVDHPDWFIGLDHSPFPSYSFSGTDFSHDNRAGIYLEDHYFSRSDAAVVFKRVDHQTGSEKYIYHGNDGTSMPWNDTAQLDYLNPEVREAVIQTILHVARQFPIIRFDAAMTLAKKHYQRLWYPEPGSGGAIPSRAEHGMTRQQFNQAMPQEFWREVVDRVAQEVPDTLLLAEAFWLMEGYFVRTLGMHRVYNSAFMNMLRDEDNAKYRAVMKNTLEFDLEIMKRFVNFMNNPDEQTAVSQFGKGDKYFGICTLMCTLPGLPMFGHGQIEGFAEKYGMEYRRAYWDEQPDQNFVARHEWQIFPLLHRRPLFADVQHFLLYDFWSSDGKVNEDVFAYSNRYGDERALVVYHNKYGSTRGWIRTSVGFAQKSTGGEARIVQRSLREGLALDAPEGMFTIFRDSVTGMEYLHRNSDLCDKGLYVELGAYEHHVFLDMRQVHDNAWRHYEQLAAYLNGRGVPSIDGALLELMLQPIQLPFADLENAGWFTWVMQHAATAPDQVPDEALLTEAEMKSRALLGAITGFMYLPAEVETVTREMRSRYAAALRLTALGDDEMGVYLREHLNENFAYWGILASWLNVHLIGKLTTSADFAEQSRSWIDEFHLGRIIAGALRELGMDEPGAEYAVTLVKALTAHQQWEALLAGKRSALTAFFADADVQRVLGVNRHLEILWFNQEAFEGMLRWIFTTYAVTLLAEGLPQEELQAAYAALLRLHATAAAADYQVERLLEQGEDGSAGSEK
ncbi:MAG: alpha-amylase family glycosyl hydrolase [Armatimonadota bacterium]